MLKKFLPGYLSRRNVGLFFVNYLFQRIFRINAKTKVNLHFTSRFAGSSDLCIIGNSNALRRCLFSNNSIYINTSSNGIVIDSSVHIASGVKIISSNHDVHDLDKPGLMSPGISIGQNCWLGANSVILPGVNLGAKTIVAAGAVVTKSFKGNCIVAGVPAIIIKNL